MLYRPHRRFLDEAMAEVREVNSLSDISEASSCEWYSFDKRINWDTWIVLDKAGIPLGFSNGELK